MLKLLIYLAKASGIKNSNAASIKIILTSHIRVSTQHSGKVVYTWVSAVFRFTSDSCQKKLSLTKGTLGGTCDTDWIFMLSTFNWFVFLLGFAISVSSQQMTSSAEHGVAVDLTTEVNLLLTLTGAPALLAEVTCPVHLWFTGNVGQLCRSLSTQEPYLQGGFFIFFKELLRELRHFPCHRQWVMQSCFNRKEFAVI